MKNIRIKILFVVLSLGLTVGIFYVIDKKLKNKVDDSVKVENYDLGEFTFEENGVDITSPFKGSIGIPKGKNNPIVFILHGSHDIDGDVKKPFAEGFEYLVEHLAKQGYLAISINVNRAYMFEPVEGNEQYRINKIFEENYNLVKQAIEGKNVFSYSLKDKGDLSKINLVGHSRGGENTLNIIRNEAFRSIPFTSTLLVAPSQNFELTHSYADIPTGIIVPQFDTDVVQQDGINYFNYAYFKDEARRYPIQYAYLLNADHNPFNTMVNQKGMFNYEDVTYIKEEEQREFLKDYSTDFLNKYNKKDFYQNVIKGYENQYIPAYYFTEMKGNKLIRPNKIFRDIKYDDIIFNYMETGSIDNIDSTGAFNLPGNLGNIPLYNMEWKEKKGNVTIEVPVGYHNFYDYSGISILLGLDSSNAKNNSNKETALTIKIVGFDGKEENIHISSKKDSALTYIEGELISNASEQKKWNHYTPLGSFIIDFELFKNVNAQDGIKEIQIIPESNEGSIVIGGMDFY